MSSAFRLEGMVLAAGGWMRGALGIDASGRIDALAGEPIDEAAVRDSPLPIILPGFIDTHVHGGAGHDIMEGGNAAEAVARCHAATGTTALLATTMTAPSADLRAAFQALAPLCDARRPARPACARLLGVHLEGPYINPGKLGAQPNFARPFDAGEFDALNRIAPIRIVTLAPEVAANIAAIGRIAASGCRIQIGHSLGTYEDARAALAAGAHGFTHLFNAMTGLHHRAPGMVGAALAHAEYAEIIPDLLHVHAGAIRAAARAIPKLFCVTDSTAAAGMPDGEYRLGRHTVTKCLGGVRLADGTLAGSTLTLDQALRNLVHAAGFSLAAASRAVSSHAAEFLGLADRGRIAVGAWADLVVLDRDLAIREVRVEGRKIP